MKKGKEKKEENYIKKGGKGLKNASFWAINPPQTYLSGKKFNLKRGGMIRIHNIYPWIYILTDGRSVRQNE